MNKHKLLSLRQQFKEMPESKNPLDVAKAFKEIVALNTPKHDHCSRRSKNIPK